MSRYFFHIRDSLGLIEDTEGLEFASLELVFAEAERSAKSLAEQRKHMPVRCEIVVVNADGVEIATVAVAPSP